jgi:predicted DNA-binding transcriptional regulator AlpA
MSLAKSFHQTSFTGARGFSRNEAAAYVGLGVTFFDEKVAEGVLPKPLKIGKRKLWDRRELDAAFDKLKGSVQNLGVNPWDT